MATAASSSFLALRGVTEDFRAAARAVGPRTPVFTVCRARRFPRAALAASPPARGSKNPNKIGGVSNPLAFDPLGVREAGGTPSTSTGGGGGLSLWGTGTEAVTGRGNARRQQLPPVSPDRLDRWIRSSVTEIVKCIEEAPFLSFIFADDDTAADGCSSTSSSSKVRIEREAAETGDWPSIQKRWGSSAPDGVILVEELKDQPTVPAGDEQDDDLARHSVSGRSGMGFAATRTWGVLVQGRGGGADCTACYILNTCRVRSAFGCCTHFCLVRAQCFGDESAEQQLRNAWLAYGYRN